MNEFERSALIERLGLDPEVLGRVAHRTHQWAQAVEGLLERRLERGEEEASDRQQPTVEALRGEAASLFAIAGSYGMLLDQGLARESMLPAARHLIASGSSFAYPIAICAREPEIAFASLRDLPPDLAARDRANILLASSWVEITASGREVGGGGFARNLLLGHLDWAHPQAESTVGRMRVPLGAIAQLVHAADELTHGEGSPERLSRALHDALLRVHDVTAAAMRDRYHWRRLMSSVLPVEPEAAVLAAVAMAAAMRTGSVEEVERHLELPPLARVPLIIGGEMAEQAL